MVPHRSAEKIAKVAVLKAWGKSGSRKRGYRVSSVSRGMLAEGEGRAFVCKRGCGRSRGSLLMGETYLKRVVQQVVTKEKSVFLKNLRHNGLGLPGPPE